MLNEMLRKYNIRESDIIKKKEDYYVITSKGVWVFLDGVTWVEQEESAPTSLEDDIRPLIKRIILPESVKGIGHYAFMWCDNLEDINFPKSIEYIGETILSSICPLLINKQDGVVYLGDILYGYKYLGDILDTNKGIPKDTSIVIKEGIRLIVDGVFLYGENIVSVKIPSSVRYICERAFEGCTGLKNIEISNGVKDISYYAFQGCSNLSEIILPNSLEVIREGAFGGCTKLTHIEIPNGVKILEDCFRAGYGHSDCDLIKSVVLSGSIEKLSYKIFKDCKNLKDVYYAGSEEQLKKIVVDTGHRDYKQEDLILPKGAKIHFNSNPSIEEEVKRLLSEGKSEKEVYKSLKDKGSLSSSGIIEAIAKVDPTSSIVVSFCNKIIVPNILSFFKKEKGISKYTVGEVADILYKKYPENLVNKAIVSVLREQYLVD